MPLRDVPTAFVLRDRSTSDGAAVVASVIRVPAVPLPEPPLATERLLLRTWRAEDATALFEAFHDAEVLRFSWSSDADYTHADAVRYLQDREPARQRGEEVQWALVDPDGHLLGGASLYQLDAEQGSASVGYWLAAAARGRELATTAVRLIADYVFTRLSVERLELTCGPDNIGSQGVAQRAGFLREGLLRSHMPFKGARRDTLLFSLLPKDLHQARHG